MPALKVAPPEYFTIRANRWIAGIVEPVAGAVGRLEDALSRVAAGTHVRIGFAGYDRGSPTTVDHLLQQARVAAHRIHA